MIDGAGGTITVGGGVLSRVVMRAAESAAGARVRRPRRGPDVEVDDGRARIALQIAVAYGLVVPDVAREVQERVADALRGICGLESVAVDVSVEELDE